MEQTNQKNMPKKPVVDLWFTNTSNFSSSAKPSNQHIKRKRFYPERAGHRGADGSRSFRGKCLYHGS